MSIIEKAIAKLEHHNQKVNNANDVATQGSVDKRNINDENLNAQLKFNIETMSAAGIVSPNEYAPYLSDEFRRIKRPILNNAFGSSSDLVEGGNVVMVTSSLPGEGKSFTSVNLALSVALEKDLTVVLIDADVTVSKITRMFELENRLGLTDKLDNQDLDLSKILIKTDFPSLAVIPAGKKTNIATELLASNHMKDLVDEIGNRYKNRLIIFDSPPLLATPESVALAEQTGQIVVVVESNKTPQSAVLESISLLNKEKAISLILNKTSKGFGYPQYGQYSYYGKDAKTG